MRVQVSPGKTKRRASFSESFNQVTFRREAMCWQEQSFVQCVPPAGHVSSAFKENETDLKLARRTCHAQCFPSSDSFPYCTPLQQKNDTLWIWANQRDQRKTSYTVSVPISYRTQTPRIEAQGALFKTSEGKHAVKYECKPTIWLTFYLGR